MPNIESCINTVCTRDKTCFLIRSLTTIRDSASPLTSTEIPRVIEEKRKAKVIFNCPSVVSDLFVAIRAKAKP